MMPRRSANQLREAKPLTLHLIDGTYELFRHFYGLRRFTKGVDRPYGAVVGVLQTLLQLIESGAKYIGEWLKDRRRLPSPSYSAGLEFELTGVAQSVELA